MRRGAICAALLLIVTSPGPRIHAATPSDPFTIDRAGAATRAAVASLPIVFRLEPSDDDAGLACSRWSVMTLVRASPDQTWQLVRATQTENLEVTLYGIPGRTTLIVVECPGRAGYSLHGPQVWGRRDAAETIHVRRRRTVRTRFGVPAAQTVRMVLSQRYAGDHWPECHQLPAGAAECIGVPYGATGVAMADGSAGVRWGGAVPHAVTVQVVSSIAARWGRLLYFVDAGSGIGDDLRVTAWRQRPRPPGISPARVRVVPDALTDVYPLGRRSFWVVGQGDPDNQFLEVKGAGAMTVRVGAETLIGAAADRPARVFLRPVVPVAGLIVDARGGPAEGALVSLFELIRSRPPSGEALGGEIVTKRWMAETVSDSNGRFSLHGPPPGEYEFLAVHPTEGRTVDERLVGGAPITLRLRPTPRVRGRVLGDHLPLVGVPVRSVPDRLVFARTADPVAVLAPGTVTDAYGEFELSLPEQGSGEVVIGGGGRATVRHHYADAESLPDVTDLGDIVLAAPTRLTVRLPHGGCDLMAAGPIGSLGMGRVRATFDPQHNSYRFALPETGFWWLEAICDGASRTLVPPAVRVDRASRPNAVEATFAPLNNSNP